MMHGTTNIKNTEYFNAITSLSMLVRVLHSIMLNTQLSSKIYI